MRLLALVSLALSGAALAKPGVVVSFAPYASVVRSVAGTDATVTQLVPSGANPHAFEPRPSDVRAVANAKLVVLGGLGIDEWVGGLVRSSGTRARVVEIGERVKFDPIAGEDGGDEDHGHDAEGHDEHGGVDPHIWLDASIMARAATLVGEELARVDPARAAGYRSRARAEAGRLNALHAELKRTLAPVRNEKIVTFHGAWAYWARAYGPKVAAVVEPFPGKEPSAKYVRDVVKLLRAQGARAIFAEPQLPVAPAQAIAQSAGSRLYVVAPEGDARHRDYAAMMRANAQIFLKALR